MLYGSRARGDAGTDSDVDLLVLSGKAREPYQDGLVSVTVYTPKQLRRMCEAGSLFALHLVMEGQILADPSGTLRETLETYRAPVSYDALIDEVTAAAKILDLDTAQIAKNPIGLTRLALYLVRTAAITRYIEQTGDAAFSLEVIAAALELPRLPELFVGREDSENLDVDRCVRSRVALAELLRRPISNPYGSIEALAVNLEKTHPTASKLALRILGGSQNLGYGDLLLEPLTPPNA
jgi:nucleotidyltransferase-like protein